MGLRNPYLAVRGPGIRAQVRAAFERGGPAAVAELIQGKRPSVQSELTAGNGTMDRVPEKRQPSWSYVTMSNLGREIYRDDNSADPKKAYRIHKMGYWFYYKSFSDAHAEICPTTKEEERF